MTPQYMMVNECLVSLKQVDLPPINKLRIIIQLIQIKRLLLREDIPAEECEDSLRALLSDIRKIRMGEHDADIVSSLMGRTGRFLNLPKCEQWSAAVKGCGAFALWK